DRAIFVVGEPAPRIAALVAVPGRAGQAERLGVGHAALDVGRAAQQLAIGEALPGLAAGVDHLVAHGDGVLAAREHVAAPDLDAVRPAPDERHTQFVLARREADAARVASRHEALLMVGRRAGGADPAALRGVEVLRGAVEQQHRRAGLVAGLRV